MNTTLRNLLIDAAAGVGYLVALYPDWTGLKWHEWLGLAVFGVLVTHLLLHWRWIIALSKRFLAKLPAKARLNYVLDAALVVAFLVVTASGVVVSSVFDMPYRLKLSIAAFSLWVRIHSLSSDLTVALVLLHLALHWRWIHKTISRLLLPRRDATNADPTLESASDC